LTGATARRRPERSCRGAAISMRSRETHGYHHAGGAYAVAVTLRNADGSNASASANRHSDLRHVEAWRAGMLPPTRTRTFTGVVAVVRSGSPLAASRRFHRGRRLGATARPGPGRRPRSGQWRAGRFSAPTISQRPELCSVTTTVSDLGRVWYTRRPGGPAGRLRRSAPFTLLTWLRRRGRPLSGEVAWFTAGSARRVGLRISTATIDWGDGSPASAGTVMARPEGGFLRLRQPQPTARPGGFAPQITLTAVGGGTRNVLFGSAGRRCRRRAAAEGATYVDVPEFLRARRGGRRVRPVVRRTKRGPRWVAEGEPGGRHRRPVGTPTTVARFHGHGSEAPGRRTNPRAFHRMGQRADLAPGTITQKRGRVLLGQRFHDLRGRRIVRHPGRDPRRLRPGRPK